LTKLQTAIDIADNTKHFMSLINIVHVPNEKWLVTQHSDQAAGWTIEEYFFCVVFGAIQSGSETHPALYQLRTQGSFS